MTGAVPRRSRKFSSQLGRSTVGILVPGSSFRHLAADFYIKPIGAMPPVGSSYANPQQKPKSLSMVCPIRTRHCVQLLHIAMDGPLFQTGRNHEYLKVCKKTKSHTITDYQRPTMTNYQNQIPNTVLYKTPPIINRLRQFTFNQALHSPLGRPDVRDLQPDGFNQRVPVSLRTLLRREVGHHDDIETGGLPIGIGVGDDVLVDQDLAVTPVHGRNQV